MVKSNNSAHLNYITIKRMVRTTRGVSEREEDKGRESEREGRVGEVAAAEGCS